MSDVTRILSAIERGDPQAAEQLLPLVYDELRKLAAQKPVPEKSGQTPQATNGPLRCRPGHLPGGLAAPWVLCPAARHPHLPLAPRRGRAQADRPASPPPRGADAGCPAGGLPP